MSNKPKNGAMQIKAGKMRMYLNGEWQDFGVMYVAADMRKIAKPVNGRRSAYAPFLIKMAELLELYGLSSILTVKCRLEYFYGCSEKWMAQDCKIWHGWLQQIWQFRNCTGKKDCSFIEESNKNFRDNFDKVFQTTGDPAGSPQHGG